MDSERRRTRKPRYERRIFALALATGVPAAVIALFLLWLGDFAARTQWTLTILLVVVWLAFVAALWERVVRPLQTISNMLAALREGDFSLRARGSDPNDALGLLFLELNSLGEDLRAQRLSALEATALGVGARGPAAAGLARRSPEGVGGDRGSGGVAQSSDGRVCAVGTIAPSTPRAGCRRRVGATRSGSRDAPIPHRVPGTGRHDPSRWRATRPASDQPGPERGRCDPREQRSRRARVDGARRPRGCVGSRRGPWPGRHRQPVRAVLHYQGRRVRDRARALASDCRGARRDADAREPRWAGLRSSAVLTDPQRRRRRPTQRGGGALGAAART